jgi:hypothetical protein
MRSLRASFTLLGLATAHCGGQITPATGSTEAPDGGAVSPRCVDVVDDPHNCGVCGRDCQGGACADGVCQPVLVAAGEDYPVSLAVDDSRVYWLNWTDPDLDPHPNVTTVRSIGKGGGSIATLGSTAPFAGGSLRVDDTSLYFYRSMIDGTPLGGAGVMRVCKDGSCPLERIYGPGEDNFNLIAIDGTSVYFHTDQLTGLSPSSGVIKVDKGGAAAGVVLAGDSTEGGSLYDLVVDDTSVYSTSNGSLLRFDKNAGDPSSSNITSLASIGTTGWEGDLAVDAAYVFVMSKYALDRIDKRSGQSTTLATWALPAFANTFALDADRAYWFQWEGPAGPASLRSVGKDGSHLVALPIDAPAGPGLIAVDDSCIYWVGQTGVRGSGNIMKVVKPR